MSLHELRAMPEGRYEVGVVAEERVALLIYYIADVPVAAVKLTGSQALELANLLEQAEARLGDLDAR